MVEVLETHSDLHGSELRFAVQGVVHALTRFSLANADEMRAILEKPTLSDDEILIEAARNLSLCNTGTQPTNRNNYRNTTLGEL